MKIRARIDRISLLPIKSVGEDGIKYQFGFELDKLSDEEFLLLKHCCEEGGAEIEIFPGFVESIRKSKAQKAKELHEKQVEQMTDKLRRKHLEQPIITEG